MKRHPRRFKMLNLLAASIANSVLTRRASKVEFPSTDSIRLSKNSCLSKRARYLFMPRLRRFRIVFFGVRLGRVCGRGGTNT
jgi:hypothetical protein